MLQTKRLILSIDPGTTGAYGVFKTDCLNPETVSDIPTSQVKVGKKYRSRLNLAVFLRHMRTLGVENIRAVVIENVGERPGQRGMFQFGRSVGQLEGVFAALGIPVFLVSPARWKKYFKLIGQDKESARQVAISLFPAMQPFLKRKKDVDRAESLLIGYYWLSTSFATVEGLRLTDDLLVGNES